jgi:hypothetical protein
MKVTRRVNYCMEMIIQLQESISHVQIHIFVILICIANVAAARGVTIITGNQR